jgi:hypothetical protein
MRIRATAARRFGKSAFSGLAKALATEKTAPGEPTPSRQRRSSMHPATQCITGLSSESQSGHPRQFFFRLHAVNLVTKAVTKGDNLSAEAQVGGATGPIVLEVQGKGLEQDPNHAGMVYFDPNYQFNRAALLLLNGKVYAAFGAPGDNPPFHGWVLSFDATSLKIANPPFCTTPDTTIPAGSDGETTPSGGSIWQAGFGLAADSGGYLYAITGNGLYDGSRNFADSLIKLDGNLTLQASFAPWNNVELMETDTDFGSGGPVVLPDNTGGGSFVIGCGKDANVYLVERSAMKTLGMRGSPQAMLLSAMNPLAEAKGTPSNPNMTGKNIGSGPGVWGGPAYFGLGNSIYYCGDAGPLQAFTLSNGSLYMAYTAWGTYNLTPESESFPAEGGVNPVVTSNGLIPGTGIVWAVTRTGGNVPVHLRAYDAVNLTKGNIFDDVVGPFALAGSGAFIVPVAVNGKVYVASDNASGTGRALAIYGVLGNISLVTAALGYQKELQVVCLLGGQPCLTWQGLGGGWNKYGLLPGPNPAPNPPARYTSVISGLSSNGLLQVICLGQTDGLPYLVWQDAGGTWHYYGQLPCPANTTFASIATGVGNAAQLQVVCIGKTDGLPYLIYQDTGGTWHSYGVLPHPAGATFAAVATGTGNGGQLQVVCIGRNDGLPYLIYQDTGGTWHSYGALLAAPAGPFVAVATGTGNGGQLQVVCIGRNDGLPHLIWQDTGGTWHDGGQLPYPSPPPGGFVCAATGVGNGSQLQLTLIGKADGQPYLIYQDTGGTWHFPGLLPSPTPLGSSAPPRFGAVTAGVDNGAQLQVVLVGLDDGLARLIWQDTGSAWHPYGLIPQL